MRILELHEITSNHLNFDYSNFDMITFDDGLYSQFKYFEFFKSLNIPLVYFISANIICPEHIENQNAKIDCISAHQKIGLNLNGVKYTQNKEYLNSYMKMSQIRYISKYAEIGGHGFNHLMCNTWNDIREEVDNCLEILKEFNIKKYCLPYNQNSLKYNLYLKSKGLEVFGPGRLNIF